MLEDRTGIENDVTFISPTLGPIKFSTICRRMAAMIARQKDDKYTIMVGTDSHIRSNREVCFVTVIFIHRTGKGGQFFYRRYRKNRMTSLKQRMIYEATQSLTIASMIAAQLHELGCPTLNLEVHADVGSRGDSRAVLKEIIGMIEAQGFVSRVKPDAPAASKIADRFAR